MSARVCVRVAALLLGLTAAAGAAPKESGADKLSRSVARALAGRPAAEIATIARSVVDAYARGAESPELINLVTDLHKDGVGAPGIVNAIEAVGRLAEDGLTDAETRRGVALVALQNLRDGVRGRELAEAIREEAGHAADADHGGGSANDGGGRSDDAKDKADIRDELRRNPPPGLSGDRGPAGARERGNPNNDKNNKGGNDKDKGKPDNAGPKK